jgi:hypothetical protein
MRSILLPALFAAGCVEGLAPEEIGIGRRVGMYPGDVAAVLPPLTDPQGNLYVVTGVPDSTGVPQPGTAHSGGARGGWSVGCATGTGLEGGARGWIGAFDGRGWFWTGTAIVELDVASGGCTTKLDTDPVSASDLMIVAAAPLLVRNISGRYAMAIVKTLADTQPHLVTIDLDLGLLGGSQALGAVEVLAVGADEDAGEAAFMLRDASGTRVAIARAYEGIVATIPVTGMAPSGAVLGELGFGTDGSVAAVLGTTMLATGSRAGLTIGAAPFTASTLEHDDDGQLWLAGIDASGPRIAPLVTGQMGTMQTWTCAKTLDQALANGVVVIDERAGERTATRWTAHAASGPSALLPQQSAPAYAVGARAILIADPAVDRGGIPYSQLAVIPVGVVMQ